MSAVAEPPPLVSSRRERLRRRLDEPVEAFGAIWKNRALRRLEYAWVGSVIGTWAFGTALGVYAYGKGGATAVGLAATIRMLPTIFFAPLVSSLGDRYPRVAVMVGSDLVRCFFFVAAALCIMADGPPLAVYIIGGLLVLSASCFRPAQAALLPSLTDTPEQLTAMNVVSSTVESVGFFAGPALGGILYAATNAETVFFASAASCLWSAAMLVGVGKASREAEAEAGDTGDTKEEQAQKGGFLRESVEGYRTIGRDKRLRT